MKIEVRDVTYVYPQRDAEKVALQGVNLTIDEQSFFGIVGPNGSGKTTLLHILAGIKQPASGSVEFIGEQRGECLTALVFQGYALLPWRITRGNVGFGPEVKGKPKPIYRRIADFFMGKVRLQGTEALFPFQLSGGMKQRAGIGRALATHPEVLLLDEPFAQLDPQGRVLMRQELERLWAHEKKTFVYVTHNLEEAVLLCDRVAVFSSSPGRVIDVIDVPLARPRSFDSMSDPAFAQTVKRIWENLEGEVEKAMREPIQPAKPRRARRWSL
ncbi:MAG: ABC transporter ATP-binding protein [Nitrospinota bacterium]